MCRIYYRSVEWFCRSALTVNNTFTILGITVKVVAATELGSGVTIAAGSSLKIEGTKSGDTQVTATKISSGSGGGGGGGGGGNKTKLRGPLDQDADQVNKTMRILGVPINATGAIFTNSTSAAFFAAAKKDKIIKASGTESPPNAILAEEVEFDD